jgi:hypothetical protein
VSPRRCRTPIEFFPNPPKTTTSTIRSAPPNLPLTSMPPRSYAILVISLWPPTRDLEDRKWDSKTVGSSIAAEPDGTTSTAISVADWTRQQGHTTPTLAQLGPNRPTKTPPPRCTKPALTPPPPVCHRTSPPPGNFVAARRPACPPLPR